MEEYGVAGRWYESLTLQNIITYSLTTPALRATSPTEGNLPTVLNLKKNLNTNPPKQKLSYNFCHSCVGRNRVYKIYTHHYFMVFIWFALLTLYSPTPACAEVTMFFNILEN